MLENVYTVFVDGHRLVFFFCFVLFSRCFRCGLYPFQPYSSLGLQRALAVTTVRIITVVIIDLYSPGCQSVRAICTCSLSLTHTPTRTHTHTFPPITYQS